MQNYFHFIHHTGYVHVISFPNISFTMYLDTVKELQKWQDEAEHWKSQPTICHTSHNGMGEVSIELCQAIGKVTPGSKESLIKFPNQPSFIPRIPGVNLIFRSLKEKNPRMIS